MMLLENDLCKRYIFLGIFNRFFRRTNGKRKKNAIIANFTGRYTSRFGRLSLQSVPLLAISSSAVRARFSRFNISLRRMSRLIYGFCRAIASRVWVGERIHKRVVLVMQIRERVGKREGEKREDEKNRVKERKRHERERRTEREMTNAVNINSSWPPSGRLRIIAAQVSKMAKSFVNIEELLGQLWK